MGLGARKYILDNVELEMLSSMRHIESYDRILLNKYAKLFQQQRKVSLPKITACHFPFPFLACLQGYFSN